MLYVNRAGGKIKYFSNAMVNIYLMVLYSELFSQIMNFAHLFTASLK